MEVTKSIAGMSLGGGKKENFFFALLEFYESEQRWFLRSLKQVKDESNLNQDEVITSWIDGSLIKQLVVDFPLSKPICESCDLKCPGEQMCPESQVRLIRQKISSHLDHDIDLIITNPKKYEQERELDNQIDYSKDILKAKTTDHILSKSFKRKLKKGFVPYWNRPLDFWVWENYYDQLLSLFNYSYDSFGNVSLMLLYKFHYLLKHFPQELKIFESQTFVILIELLRAGIITKKNILELKDIDVCTLARVRIVKSIEKSLNLFIYEKDIEIISKNSKAFDSFLLAVAGTCLINQNLHQIPQMYLRENESLIIPRFYKNDNL